MTVVTGAPHHQHERISIPTLWIAIALSVILHAAGLFGWVPKGILPFQEPKLGEPSGSLAIRLVPLTAPPVQAPPPAPSVRSTPRPTAPAVPEAPQTRANPAAPRIARIPDIRPFTPASPPVITTDRDSPGQNAVAPPAESARPAPAEDLASLIASRRRAREGAAAPAPSPAAPVESEQDRHNRIVAENLGLTNVPSFGNDPERGGGVFQIRSIGYDIAEVAFFGWNKEINRNSLQSIEVRKGNSPNMEIAVTRRIIGIIRERTPGDFLWQSRRLGRGVWLSARLADNAGLEEFIQRELFPQFAPAQKR